MIYIEDHDKIWQLDDKSDEFIDAAENGDSIKISKMLDDKMHPDTQGPKGWTALRKAALRDNLEVACILLNRGADVDATNYTGKTALMMASAYNHYDMVALLLLYGANPNLTNCSGRTALMIAASNGYEHVVGALMDKSTLIDLDQTDHNGISAIDLAAKYGHVNVVKMLDAAGVKPRHDSLEMYPTSISNHVILSGGAA